MFSFQNSQFSSFNELYIKLNTDKSFIYCAFYFNVELMFHKIHITLMFDMNNRLINGTFI